MNPDRILDVLGGIIIGLLISAGIAVVMIAS